MHSQFTDGAKISKPKSLSSSSNATKSTSALPLNNGKNDEVADQDNKMKKAGLSTSNVMDPKKRLLVEENKGKVREFIGGMREKEEKNAYKSQHTTKKSLALTYLSVYHFCSPPPPSQSRKCVGGGRERDGGGGEREREREREREGEGERELSHLVVPCTEIFLVCSKA